MRAKRKRLGPLYLTPAEWAWLEEQALFNKLAADVLYRFNYKYGRRASLLRRFNERFKTI